MKGIYSGDAHSDYKRRVAIAVYIVIALFFVLFLRFFYLQILRGGRFLEFSEKNRISIKVIKALRGKILDRKGELLADNRPSFDLAFTRGYASKDTGTLLNEVKDFWDWDIDEGSFKGIVEKVNQTNRYDPAILKKDITRDELAKVVSRAYWLDGVRILDQPVRDYPYGDLLSHALGYMSEIDKRALKVLKESGDTSYDLGDYVGQSGVELMMERHLRGDDGAIPYVEDARGRTLGEDVSGRLLPAFRRKAPTPGNNLYLTIDLRLQKIVESEFDKRSGAVVAMDPKNGDILALMSRPSYKPALFTRGVSGEYWRELLADPKKPLYDRALRGFYPPASTFKIIDTFAALNEKVVDPSFSYNCKGSYRLGREVKRCWKREGHGMLDLRNAIIHSCDVYFYDLGRKLGIETIARYSRMFGLGDITRIGINRENKGIIPDSAWKKARFGIPWVEGETMSVAVGQGYIAVTPIQLASMLSAVANGGKLWKANIVKRVEDYKGNTVLEHFPELRHEIRIDKKIFDFVKNALFGVVNDPGGTAFWTVRSKNVPIAGKTGTGQVAKESNIRNKSAEELQDHAWFICFAPFEDPQIVLVVFVEHGGHGSSASGPIAKRIIEQYFKEEKDDRRA